MRIALAEISQETDTFSPVVTTLDDFQQVGLYEGPAVLQVAGEAGPIGGFLRAARLAQVSLEPVPILLANALAGGRLTADTLAALRERLLAGLRTAPPQDGLFLSLHGAAAAEGEDDVEGHLLAAVRQVLGPDLPIVCPLDHHANITARMLANASQLVGHRTQPHDPFGTGYLAGELLLRQVRGEIHPTMAWHKIPMVSHQEMYLTVGGPMKEWFDLAREMETRPGVLSVSPFPMQCWLDVQEAGWATVVVTDGDPALARTLSAELADAAWARRERFWELTSLPPAEAIRQAEATPAGPILLSDTGDSVLGGASGDSTVLLRAMVDLPVHKTALLTVFDPEAVAQAQAAGLGASQTFFLGGKRDNLFSRPVELTCRVAGFFEGRVRASVFGLESFDMGHSVRLDAGPIQVVVSDVRGIGGTHPIVYRSLGLEPSEAGMIVVKTASNFQYFREIAQGVLRADTLGQTTSHLERFPWVRAPRPLYPMDAPFSWHAPA